MDALPVPAEPERRLAEKLGEVEAIADRLAFSYRQSVNFYIKQYGLSAAEAHEKVNAGWSEVRESLLETPARKFVWDDYQGLAEIDPALALDKWETVKAEAHAFVVSGQAGAEAVECSWASTPWERAQFGALRLDLSQDWQPRGGIEQTLIDQMAQAYTLQLKWTAILMQRSEGYDRDVKTGEPYWDLPRVSKAEAIQEAAAMVDRWNRMFLRCLRALRDMRRYMPPVIVNNPGQVNIAAEGGQQVNVAEAF